MYPCVSDELDPVFLLSALDRPLPVELDSVNDAVVVPLVDAGGEVGQSVVVADEGGKLASRHSLKKKQQCAI